MKQKTTYRTVLIRFNILTVTILMLVFLLASSASIAQESIKELSREEISRLSQDDLLEMPLEDLMQLVRRFKLSSLEELYEKVLNPEIETASKFSEKYFNSPTSTSVITSEDIMASGAFNIPEVLRLVPGIIVRQKTNGNYDVHIRGNDNIPSGQTMFYSENSLTLVMIDHRPVYNHFQGGTFWETLPLSLTDIDRIEIIYGPSSALYGPNAVSGVIHIFTKKQVKEGFSSQVLAQLSNNVSQDMYANIAYGKDKFNAKISANYQNLSRFQDEYYAFLDSVRFGRYIPSDSLSYFASSTNKKFPNPSLASNTMAANLYLNYEHDDEGGISFSTGVQQSDIQSIFLDTREFSLTGRRNSSMYSNLKYYYKGFNLNASYNLGEQNLALGYPSYKFLFGNFQTNIDYLYKWKNLKIQPGFNYQYVFYDDEAYLETDQIGIFNGRQDLSNTAVYLRLDYLLLQKLRLTAAGRWEWFKLPEQDNFSYQLTASYEIDLHSNIRMVYSKANRGPFMWDYHVNYTQNIQDGQNFWEINYHKNPDLKLLEMQMFELGFRSHLSKNISTDLSVFYNMTNNYNLPEWDLFQHGENEYQLEVRKANLPLQSYQMGMSMMLEYVLSKKFRAKVFGSLQQTSLDKVSSYYNLNDSTGIIIRNDSKLHKSTPKFVGGFNLNYTAADRFMMNMDMYYLSSQEVFTYDGLKTVKAKAILNMKVSYKILKKHQVFISGRNILNNTEYEFIFADKVGSEFLIGLSIHL